jgi:5'-nucleotidase
MSIDTQDKPLFPGKLEQVGRKKFLLLAAAAAAAAKSPLNGMTNWLETLNPPPKNNESFLLNLLHTNDFHSRIEAFPANHPQAGKGGIQQLTTLIQKQREANPNTLLLDSGDVFQGTPYFNYFGGSVEYSWMTKMGYHATTMGNHDFDNGIDHLANMLALHPKIPMVNCNYSLKGTALFPFVKQKIVVEINNKRIGITGVGINPDNLITERLIPGLTYNDPIIAVQKTVDELHNIDQCDLVFVLSHLGYQYDTDKIDDIKLGSQTHGIAAILGGHTHTFLPQATVVKNAKGKTVLVNQAGWGGLMLGQLQFSV